MSNQVFGVDRCMMQKGLIGGFVRGSVNILARLAQGWEIIPSERNHLTGDYGVKSTQITEPLQTPKKAGRPRK